MTFEEWFADSGFGPTSFGRMKFAWDASRSEALKETEILVRAIRQKRHGPTREYTAADEAADAIAKLKTATRGGE